MLMIQIVTVLVGAGLAYFISKSGPWWKVIIAMFVALPASFFCGIAASVPWADGDSDMLARAFGTVVLFGGIASIAGAIYGRRRVTRSSVQR